MKIIVNRLTGSGVYLVRIPDSGYWDIKRRAEIEGIVREAFHKELKSEAILAPRSMTIRRIKQDYLTNRKHVVKSDDSA